MIQGVGRMKRHDILRTTITCELASSSERHSPLLQGVAWPLERELPRNLFSFLSLASGFSAGEPRRCRLEYGKPAYIPGTTFPSSSSSSSLQKRIDLRSEKYWRQSTRTRKRAHARIACKRSLVSSLFRGDTDKRNARYHVAQRFSFAMKPTVVG